MGKKDGEGRMCYILVYLLLSCTAGFRVWLVAELASHCVVLVEPNYSSLMNFSRGSIYRYECHANKRCLYWAMLSVGAEWLPRMAGTHFNDHHICPTAGTANVMDMGHVSTYGRCCQDGQEADVVEREEEYSMTVCVNPT